MDSLFTKPTLFKNPSLFNGAEVLNAGGTLSQAALATLTNPTPPNGSVAEPPIVEAGVKNPEAVGLKSPRNWYYIGGAVLVLVILGYMVKK